MEKIAIAKIMKAPFNAVPATALGNLSTIGMRNFKTIEFAAKTALARTASKNCRVWKECAASLGKVRFEDGLGLVLISRYKVHQKDIHRSYKVGPDQQMQKTKKTTMLRNE